MSASSVEQTHNSGAGAGKRILTSARARANRPLSAGVSFNSPSNVVHMIRPQSAPAVRRDGQPVAHGANGSAGSQDGADEDDDLEEEHDDDGILYSDEQDQQPARVPFVGAARVAARPLDSGQRRINRPGGGGGTGPNGSAAPHSAVPALPDLLHESDDEADEEELDTKGILLQQTEVLTAELERSKQRERALHERISLLENKEEKKEARTPASRAHAPLPLPLPDALPARRPAFGLPEVGLDGVDDAGIGGGGGGGGGSLQPQQPTQARQQHGHKMSASVLRGLPPRPTNSVSRGRARVHAADPAEQREREAGQQRQQGQRQQRQHEAVDDYAEIRELTASLRIAAQHKVSNSMPASPAHSSSSSIAGAAPARPASRVTAAGHSTVTFDALRPPPPRAGSAGLQPGVHTAWGDSGSHTSTRSRAPVAGAHASRSTPPGDVSDSSSRASSTSRPHVLQPLPASRCRRQRAEASRAAQLDRAAAQTIQDAWRAHLARARFARARRRAAKANAAMQRRAGAVQARQGQDERKRRRAAAALTVQRVVRGWQARRYVASGMDWSLVQEAGAGARRAGAGRRGRGRSGGEVVRKTEEVQVRFGARRRESAAEVVEANGKSFGPGDKAAVLDSEALLYSNGTNVGRVTPLHSVGVGEESLEGLLQDLGL